MSVPGDEYTDGCANHVVTAVALCVRLYFPRCLRVGWSDSGTTWISNSFGQSFPVTNRRSCTESYAIPLSTASGLDCSAGGSRPLRSIQPSTLPEAGLIRAIRSVCQMLA